MKYLYQSRKNEAKIEWWLYKVFKINRSIPCGRRKYNKFLSCCQPIDKEHCYLDLDKKSAYCKCCNHVRLISNHIIDLDNLWFDRLEE